MHTRPVNVQTAIRAQSRPLRRLRLDTTITTPKTMDTRQLIHQKRTQTIKMTAHSTNKALRASPQPHARLKTHRIKLIIRKVLTS